MPASRDDIERMLRERGIGYLLAEHPAVFTIEELSLHDIPHRDRIAKNLFLRDDKKRGYFLISMRADAKADLKALRKIIGSRPLSFASEEDLESILCLAKGEVTPFGALSDQAHKAKVFIDSFFRSSLIGVHPNTNRATVFLNADDLIAVLQAHGADAMYLDMS